MTETPRTMVVKDPSSTLPVALRRAVSEHIGDELRRLYGISAGSISMRRSWDGYHQPISGDSDAVTAIFWTSYTESFRPVPS
jgi:hypothetical protein